MIAITFVYSLKAAHIHVGIHRKRAAHILRFIRLFDGHGISLMHLALTLDDNLVYLTFHSVCYTFNFEQQLYVS